MKHPIDINSWKRKEHYEFFKDFRQPFFGVTANLDCTRAYGYAKEKGYSFFLYYLYRSLEAVNAIESFRYRTEGDEIYCYDRIHCSTTTPNADGLFAFAFLPYSDDFEVFHSQAKEEIARIRLVSGIHAESNIREDVIHYSTLPWISFTSLEQEQKLTGPDSIPKLTFGKYFREGRRLLLPLSLYANHALMDGSHVGQYYELFQQLLDRD